MSRYLSQQEAYDLLTSDIEAWNTYRDDNFPFKPDFMEYDLSGLDLTDANLRCCDMFEVNLSNTNLTYARLDNTILYGANLQGANLTEARLINCDLSGADFRGATLDKTNFTCVNFRGVKLNSSQVPTLVDLLHLDITED